MSELVRPSQVSTIEQFQALRGRMQLPEYNEFGKDPDPAIFSLLMMSRLTDYFSMQRHIDYRSPDTFQVMRMHDPDSGSLREPQRASLPIYFGDRMEIPEFPEAGSMYLLNHALGDLRTHPDPFMRGLYKTYTTNRHCALYHSQGLIFGVRTRGPEDNLSSFVYDPGQRFDRDADAEIPLNDIHESELRPALIIIDDARSYADQEMGMRIFGMDAPQQESFKRAKRIGQWQVGLQSLSAQQSE